MHTVKDNLNSNEISDLVINCLPGIFYLQERGGKYLRWNKNFEKVTGYTAGELAVLDPITLLDEQYHAAMKAVVSRIFEEGAGEREVEMKTKDGRKLSFYLTGKAINYEGKLCLIGTGIDISERIKAEREKEQTQSHLRALFDNVGGSVFLLDAQKRLIIYNNELVEVYRVLNNNVPKIGELAYCFLPELERQARHAVLDRVLQGHKEVIEVEYVRNGEKIFYRSGFNPVFVDGQVIGISCYTIDITAQRKAEQEIQKDQERLNYHINNSPLAVIEFDKELRVDFWSKRATETFGWTEQEVSGKRITEFLIDKDDIARVEENFLGQDNAHVRKPLETKNLTKDGRIVHSRWHSSWLTDEHGNVETVMSIVRDITDLWKAELQREEMASDLVKRNNDLEQFTYIVSHNLRAPIARVIGLADILAEFELSDEEKKETLSGISESAHRLDDIIRDLNDILRLKSSLGESKELVCFSDLVKEIEQNIQYFNSDMFTITTDFTAGDCLYTLKNYLVSIFSNLVTNSIKYRRPDADPVIHISSATAGDKLILTFTDNGMGFDMDTTGKDVFGLYKRFHFHVEGKGMGLFMVKAQVETIGGKINVDSIVNKGTSFTIEFNACDTIAFMHRA
jgi:PAS domain S-box-containing protein